MRDALSENNLDSGADEIDLHGLYVKEAIDHTERSIIAAQNRGDHQIRLIVGKVHRRFPQGLLPFVLTLLIRSIRDYILKDLWRSSSQLLKNSWLSTSVVFATITCKDRRR